MAGDTREPEDLSREALNVNPESKPFSGSQWQSPEARPPANANLMAGGTEHTAGGKMPEVTIGNAFPGGLKWSDFQDLPKGPCVRDALLTGIGAGFGMGGLRAVFGATVWNACSWAVGSYILGSTVSHQYCSYRRRAEKEGMMRVVEVLNKREVEKRAREVHKEKARAERRKLKEEEQEAQFAALRESTAGGGGGKPWWKVW